MGVSVKVKGSCDKWQITVRSEHFSGLGEPVVRFLCPFLGGQDWVQGIELCLRSVGLVAEWAGEHALAIALLQSSW